MKKLILIVALMVHGSVSAQTWRADNGNGTFHTSPPSAPDERSDDFSGPKLKAVWQWNHLPDDTKWSLTERPGFLRLHSLPASDLWWARNTLTQRAIGPVSIPTAELDTSGMKAGDVAGLALFNYPYTWIGIRRQGDGQTNEMLVEQFDQTTGKTARVPLKGTRVWLRAHCDFLAEKARFSRVEPGSGVVTADHPGPQPYRKDGSCFTWQQK